MKAVLLVLLLLPFQFAEAKAVEGDDFIASSSTLGKLSYMQVLPGLRAMAEGPEGEKLIEGLNKAYLELNPSGKSNPSLSEVAQRMNADGKLPKVASGLAAGCAIAVVTVLSAGGAYVMSNPNIRRVINTLSGNNSSCPKRTSELIDSSKRSAPAAAAAGSSST